jgi:uncharacterized lipoprotein
VLRTASLNSLRALALMVLGGALGGCFFWGEEDPCAKAEEYQSSASLPPLSVPPGLDSPDTAARLEIPEGPEPGEPLAETAACLQRPPDYFDRPIYTPED